MTHTSYRIDEAGGSMPLSGPTIARRTVALYVDRESRQWVIRDPQGEFWSLPSGDGGWMRREPYHLSEESTLESVPGHYRHMLNLPF